MGLGLNSRSGRIIYVRFISVHALRFMSRPGQARGFSSVLPNQNSVYNQT